MSKGSMSDESMYDDREISNYLLRFSLGLMVLIGVPAYFINKHLENSMYPQEYRYSGKIGEDQVDFKKEILRPIWGDPREINTLAVRKPDGRGINYFDVEGSDLKLESIITTEGNRQMVYSIHDNAGKSILGEAQKQFDTYMEQIKQAKISKALEDLK